MQNEEQVIAEYRTALQRLIKDCPEQVPKGTLISNNAVAKEAGRSAGCIKRSRPIYSSLIKEIDAARKASGAQEKLDKVRKQQSQLDRLTVTSKRDRENYKQALMRELSLHQQIFEMQSEASTKQRKVTSIQGRQTERMI